MENPRLQPLRIARIPAAILADATLLFWFIAACFNHSIAQDTGLRIDKNSVLGGLNGAQILLYETENDYARLRITNSFFNESTNHRFWDIAGRIGPDNSGLEDRLNFFLNGVGDILSLRGTGRVGIGTISPTAKLDVRGSIRIDNDATAAPQPGTIRFNPVTNDFEGWNGLSWASLTGFRFYGGIGEVTDQDGNTYPTVTIGDQEWMAMNLRTTTYANGDPITLIGNDAAGNVTWSNADYGAYAIYDTSGTGYQAFDVNEFGYLYNWYAVNDGRGLCPTGWHVPTDAEWSTLSDDYLGGPGVAGGKMKEIGFIHWESPNTGATNQSGFTGLPGSLRHPNGSFDVSGLGRGGYLWSSTLSGSAAWLRSLHHSQDDLVLQALPLENGFSVRCLKD